MKKNIKKVISFVIIFILMNSSAYSSPESDHDKKFKIVISIKKSIKEQCQDNSTICGSDSCVEKTILPLVETSLYQKVKYIRQGINKSDDISKNMRSEFNNKIKKLRLELLIKLVEPLSACHPKEGICDCTVINSLFDDWKNTITMIKSCASKLEKESNQEPFREACNDLFSVSESGETVEEKSEILVEEKRRAAEEEKEKLVAEKAEAEKERLATEKAEAEKKRLISEKAEAEKERLATEKAEAEKKRLISEKAEAEKEKLVAEKAEAEKERLATEKAEAEKERLATEKAEAEKKRLISEEAEAEKKRLISEEAEAEKERFVTEKTEAEKERLTTEKAEAKKENLVVEADKLAEKKRLVIKKARLLEEEKKRIAKVIEKPVLIPMPEELKELGLADFVYISPDRNYTQLLDDPVNKSKQKPRRNYLLHAAKKILGTEHKIIELREGFAIQYHEAAVTDILKYRAGGDYIDIINDGRCPQKWLKGRNIDRLPATCLSKEVIEGYVDWLNKKLNGKAIVSLPTPKQWLIASILYGEDDPVIKGGNLNNKDSLRPLVITQENSTVSHLIGNVAELSKTRSGEYYLMGESIKTIDFIPEESHSLRKYGKELHTLGFRLVCKSDGKKCR